MTDAEKIADYDRIVEIVRDQIALEKHMRRKNNGAGIEFIRADAYGHILDVLVGPEFCRRELPRPA
jgi:hypothetical protein